MLSLETYPAFYLGYSRACYSNSTPFVKPNSAFEGNPLPCQGASSTPHECLVCGVPLKVFRKCFSINFAEEEEKGDSNMTAHLCITTYRSPNNEVLKLELCFVGQDCQRIPSILGATYGLQTKRLDLSYNAIRSLEGLEKFPHLEELILDNNFIDDSVTLPKLETLHTLSLNKNKVGNLEKFLDQVSEKFPHLRYLSLLGNEACPNQLSSHDKDEKDYRRYRLYVLNRLHGLRFLDSTAVRKTEAREARKRGGLMKTLRPPPITTIEDAEDGDNPKGPKESDILRDTMTSIPEGNGKAHNGSAGHTEANTEPSHKHKGAYGIRRYRYTGKNSEGNRFINNEHL